MNLLTEFRHTKIQIMHKTPCNAIFVNDLKCYSDWKFGAIQIELTTLTTLITEGSAKQLMINQLFGGISMIRLLWRMGCILCFACTFRDINTID